MQKPLHAIETSRFWGVVAPLPSDRAQPDDARAVMLRVVARERDLTSISSEELASAPGVELGLSRQRLPSALGDDDELRSAIACWLVARGVRRLNIETEVGKDLVDEAIDVETLGQQTRRPVRDADGLVRRIVSLAPSNLDVLLALEAGERVVGCENSSREWALSRPAEAKTVLLGPDLDPDLEKVCELQPDLVLASLTVPGMERVVSGLARRGIPHLVLAPRGVDDAMADVLRVGEALGLTKQAGAVVKHMQVEREQLRSLADRGARARVYLEWWPRPHYTPGSTCFSNELIELAGGVNVFGSRVGSSVEVEPQDIAAAQPDLAFVSWCGVDVAKLDPARLCAVPALAQLEMVQRGRVFVLDERYSGRPGPQMLEAAKIMQRHILSWRAQSSA